MCMRIKSVSTVQCGIMRIYAGTQPSAYCMALCCRYWASYCHCQKLWNTDGWPCLMER